MDSVPSNPNPLSQDKPVNIPNPPPVSAPASQQPDLSIKPPAMGTPPSPPPPSMPSITPPPSEIPPETTEQIPLKKDINFLSKALLVLGPLIMIGLFGVSFYNLIKTPETPIQAPAKPATPSSRETAKQILLNVPKNPDQVSATCLSTGEDLISEQPTNCPDPQFTWTGEEPREPGTEITGYYVYFGTNGNDDPIAFDDPDAKLQEVIRPLTDGNPQEENVFSPKDLEPGTTYYLAVAAKSNSNNPLWKIGFDVISVENLEAQVAKILFVYQYE